MPDITMCASTTCPKRESCYRNEASGTEPNPWRQSYFVVMEPNEKGECDHYSKAQTMEKNA